VKVVVGSVIVTGKVEVNNIAPLAWDELGIDDAEEGIELGLNEPDVGTWPVFEED